MGAIFVNDAFTGTAGNDLSGHTPDVGTSWSGPSGNIVFTDVNRVRCSVSTAYYKAVPAASGADYDISLDVVCQSTATCTVGVLGRITSGTTSNTDLSGYNVRLSNATAHFALIRFDAGAATTLASVAQAPVAGHTYTITLQMRGSSLTATMVESGSTLRTLTATDSTYTAAGSTGLRFNTVVTNSTGLHGDNFVATNQSGHNLASLGVGT